MVQRHLSTKAILCQQLLQSEKSQRREVEPFQHYSKGVTLYPVRALFFLLNVLSYMDPLSPKASKQDQ